MKRRKWSSVLTGLAVGALMLFGLGSVSADTGDSAKGNDPNEVIGFEGSHAPVWQLQAESPLLIGGYGDNFNYDGSQVIPMFGKAKVILDTARDGGAMIVKVKGTINPEKGKTYTGDITLHYSITKGGPAFREGGVADFIYLHGDTKQGPPVMPKVRSFLAAWGTADIYVNDELIYKGLDGHMMYTERSRDPKTRAIYNKDRSGFYSHKEPANGSVVDPNGRELHFVAHSMKKDKGNFPPHSVWLHLNFEKVSDLSDAGVGCGCQGKAGLSNCGCGAGCTTLKDCNCGPNCGCPKDGKGGCGCSVGCKTGCAKGGACPLPKSLGT